jgi:hypothetical protein
MYSATIGGFMEEMSRAYSLQIEGGMVHVYGGGSASATEPSRANAEDIRQLFLGGCDIDGMLAEVHGGESGVVIEGCYDEAAPQGEYDFDDESLMTPDADGAVASDTDNAPTLAVIDGDYDFELD